MLQTHDPRDFVVGAPVPGTKWVLRGSLGQGGMGVVLDVSKEPGIVGAMKVLLPAFAHQDAFTRRFFEEVRLLARVHHPNIVAVIDYDSLDDGAPFVVMERLTGHTLRAALRASGRALSPRAVYDITRQLCDGLYCAHSNAPPIVHRDVKPENVFLHRPKLATPVVKLIDFGIAGVFGEACDRRTIGTPRYMAPEQILGDPTSQKTDLYTVAVVVYEMLTNRFPWEVDTRDISAVINAHLRGVPAPPSRHAPWIPRLVDECILRALAKAPATRPRDAHEFVSGLYELQYADDHPAASPGVRASTAITSPSSAPATKDSCESELTFLSETLETYESVGTDLRPVWSTQGDSRPLKPARPAVCRRRRPPVADASTRIQVDGRCAMSSLLPPAVEVALARALPHAVDVLCAPPAATRACAADLSHPRRLARRAVAIAAFASLFGLSLVLSARVLQSVKGEGVHANIGSERDATVPREDAGRDIGVTREEIRVEHELPKRPAPNEESMDPPHVEAMSTSRVRGPGVFSAREKRAPGPMTVRQAPNDSLEPAPLAHTIKGARPPNDGFDELVLPHP
jgi:serine/threonine protein kinase